MTTRTITTIINTVMTMIILTITDTIITPTAQNTPMRRV